MFQELCFIERDDDESETVAAGMLNTYLNTVESVCDIYEDYIFNTKEDCILYGNKLGEIASDLQIQDLNLMKKQSKLYKQISDFLKSSEAIQFGVRGIDARVENGYVNAEWKFGKRDVGDIKDIIL